MELTEIDYFNRIYYGGDLNGSNSKRTRREGLKALKDKLGIEGMIKFIQMYSDGKGDYTKEKYENLDELTIEDFEKYIAENN